MMNVQTIVFIKEVGASYSLFAYVVFTVRRIDTVNLHEDIELFLTMLMQSLKLLLCLRTVHEKGTR